MDNKAVYFVSNIHDPSEEHPTKRRKNDGTIGIICRTVVNNAYSKNMGYVEKADMLK